MLRNGAVYPRRCLQLCGVSRATSGPPSWPWLKSRREELNFHNFDGDASSDSFYKNIATRSTPLSGIRISLRADDGNANLTVLSSLVKSRRGTRRLTWTGLRVNGVAGGLCLCSSGAFITVDKRDSTGDSRDKRRPGIPYTR